MKKLLIILLLVILFSCDSDYVIIYREGLYRVQMTTEKSGFGLRYNSSTLPEHYMQYRFQKYPGHDSQWAYYWYACDDSTAINEVIEKGEEQIQRWKQEKRDARNNKKQIKESL